MTHPQETWADGLMDLFTDADDLVSQEWSATEVGGGDPGLAAGPHCSAAGGHSPGTGGASCVAPRAPPPPGPAALSGSPQPASRATPPTSSSYHLHHQQQQQQQQQQADRGGPTAPYSAELYPSNHQLPSVETLMPGCVPGGPLPPQAHHPQQQPQSQQTLHPQHHTQHPTQPHHQHHQQQQQNTYQNLGGYQGHIDDRQCDYHPPPTASSSSLGYYPSEYAQSSSPATSPTACHVIVPNPSRIKSEYFHQNQHQQCDPSWDGLNYAGASSSSRPAPPPVPPGGTGPLVGVVKPDPDRTPPLAGRPGTAGVPGTSDLHAPGTSGTSPEGKPHPRQGWRRSTDGDPRKEKRREQNRRAALKCRIKKKGEWQILHENYGVLERQNEELQQKISNLEEEKKKLCEVLKSHQESCSLHVDLPPTSP